MPKKHGKNKIGKPDQKTGGLAADDAHAEQSQTLVNELHDTPDADEPSFNTVVETPETTPSVTRKPLGLSLLLCAFLLASLLGGVIGIVGNKFLRKPNELAQTSTELAQGLATQRNITKTHEKSLKALRLSLNNSTAKITKLEADLRVSKATNAALEKNIADTQSRLGILEADLKAALENTQSTGQSSDETTNAQDDQDAKPNAGKTIAADMPKPVQKSDITKPNIKTDIEPSKTTGEPDKPNTATPSSTVPSITVADQNIKTDQSTAPDQTVTEQSKIPAPVAPPQPEPLSEPTPNPLDVLQDTFPRTEMLDAVKAQETLAQKKPSLLQRALRKHVKIGNPSTVDHRAEIGAAQIAVNDGDISAALEHISLLNPPVRAAAAQWVLAAKKYNANNLPTDN